MAEGTGEAVFTVCNSILSAERRRTKRSRVEVERSDEQREKKIYGAARPLLHFFSSSFALFSSLSSFSSSPLPPPQPIPKKPQWPPSPALPPARASPASPRPVREWERRDRRASSPAESFLGRLLLLLAEPIEKQEWFEIAWGLLPLLLSPAALRPHKQQHPECASEASKSDPRKKSSPINNEKQNETARRAAAALRSSVAASPLSLSSASAAPRSNNRPALATRASVTTTEPVAAAAKAGE